LKIVTNITKELVSFEALVQNATEQAICNCKIHCCIESAGVRSRNLNVLWHWSHLGFV